MPTPTKQSSQNQTTPPNDTFRIVSGIFAHPIVSGIIVVVLGGIITLWVYNRWGLNLSDPASNRSPSTPQATTPPPNNLSSTAEPVLVNVSVNNGHLPGQGSRASQNITIIAPNNGKARLVWRIEGPSPENVSFALIRDKTGGLINFDDLIVDNLHDGSVTPYYGGNNIYVARVKGATAPFQLKAYPSN